MSSQKLIDGTCGTRPLCDFRDELRFEFMDLPVQMFDYYNLKTARYMARFANLIRRRIEVTPEYCVTRYKLTFDEACTEFHRVLSILVERPYIVEGDYFRLKNDRRCTPSNPDIFYPDCDCRHSPYIKAILCPPDEAWFDEFEKVLHIHEPQAPQCGDCDYPHFKYYINYSVLPKMDVCELPEEFYEEYRDILLLGTKASILRIRGRKWTDVTLGTALWKEFLEMMTVEKDRLDSYLHKIPDGGELQGKQTMRFEPAM